MIRVKPLLWRDQCGSSAIEFAIAAPVLVSFIWGLFQISLVFEANAGMQHALGEAARLATVYRTDTSDHRPTTAMISNAITTYKFGVSNGTWGTPTITTDTANRRMTITVTYSQPMNFLFFNGPSVTLTKTKVAYFAV
jgi:Flp pilus assembly protein TadG